MNALTGQEKYGVVLWLLISVFPAVVSAEGGKSSAMSNAFNAVSDDPSAISANPGGLTQIPGTVVYGGATAMVMSSAYESPSGQKERSDFQVFYTPHLYLSSDAGTENMRLGLGIFSPFGIGGRKWDESGLTRYQSTKSLTGTLAVNPTLAYRFSSLLSAGIGVDYLWSIIDAKQMVDQTSVGAGDGSLSTKARGDGWGYNAGVLMAFSERFGAGISYRSRIKVTYDGTLRYGNIAPALQPVFGAADYETGIESAITFPSVLTVGLKFRATERALFAFDLERTQWSSFRSADIHLKNPVPAAGFTDSSTPLHWKNVWAAKLGMEYTASDRLALRGGYAFIPTPVPDEPLEPGNPDANIHMLSIGFGYKTGAALFDFFYSSSFYEKRTINNNILSGTYTNFTHMAGFSIGYKF